MLSVVHDCVRVTEYESGGYAAFVSPTPLMMVVALGDVLNAWPFGCHDSHWFNDPLRP
jgi:hypothetical protein